MNRAADARTPPSGRQFELRHGCQRVIVVEVGGGLREYEVDGWAVVDGYPIERIADGARGQPLLPWPNRLEDGLYEFAGESCQLPIDELERHNAIHGLTRWLNWVADEQADDRLRLSHVLHARPGYPFTLRLGLEYQLSASGLTVRTSAHNLGDRAAPFGAGHHPYFSVGTPLVDAATLHVLADTRLEFDPERRVPTGRVPVHEGDDLNFRTPRAIGPQVIDTCFTDLARDAHGRAQATLADPASGRAVMVWADAQHHYFQTFTGDTLAPERRRRGLAIEPMTSPPNAFRSGIDVLVLQPDQSVSMEWGIGPSQHQI